MPSCARTSVSLHITIQNTGPQQWPMLVILQYFLRVSRSTGTAYWMPWYSRRVMVKVTDLTLFLMMEVTLVWSSMRLKRSRTCSSRMVISLTPDPRKMMSSIFSKPLSSANHRLERQISGTNLSIRLWEFLKRPQQEFTICTP